MKPVSMQHYEHWMDIQQGKMAYANNTSREKPEQKTQTLQ